MYNFMFYYSPLKKKKQKVNNVTYSYDYWKAS